VREDLDLEETRIEDMEQTCEKMIDRIKDVNEDYVKIEEYYKFSRKQHDEVLDCLTVNKI
jgi:hypothetical protein